MPVMSRQTMTATMTRQHTGSNSNRLHRRRRAQPWPSVLVPKMMKHARGQTAKACADQPPCRRRAEKVHRPCRPWGLSCRASGWLPRPLWSPLAPGGQAPRRRKAPSPFVASLLVLLRAYVPACPACLRAHSPRCCDKHTTPRNAHPLDTPTPLSPSSGSHAPALATRPHHKSPPGVSLRPPALPIRLLW
jgi:hypothetical protein